MIDSFSKPALKIQSKTCILDTQGLYDHGSLNLIEQSVTVNDACYIFRSYDGVNGIKVSTNENREPDPNRNDCLSSIIKISDIKEEVRIDPMTTDEEGSDGLWSIVDSGEKLSGWKLKVNDVIKMGRAMLKVVKINSRNENHQRSNVNSLQERYTTKTKTSREDEGNISIPFQVCRVCLSEQDENDNPLISPCGCTGDQKFTHLQCVQNLIKDQLPTQQDRSVITIKWTNPYCKTCKQEFSVAVKHRDQEFSLIRVECDIWDSFAILESFSKEKGLLCVYIINLFSDEAFLIGRGGKSTIKMSENSVSKEHSLLTVSKEGLYLKDNLSRYGTLVLHRGPVILNEKIPESQWMQCGRTILKFSLKQPWPARIPCIGSLFRFNKPEKIGDRQLGGTERKEIAAKGTQREEEVRRLSTKEN